MVVLEDYAKGILSQTLVEKIVEPSHKHKKFLMVTLAKKFLM